MRYKHPTHRKSLLHFDFPYYGEPGDGLRDEVGILKWTRQGGAKLVGVEEPVAENVTGTPKFGYRCLQTATNADYISAGESGNVIPVLCLNGDREYEFEFFVRPTAATAGNLVVVRDASSDLLSITKDTSNKIAVSGMGISLTSTTILALNQFSHVLVRLLRGTASVYINGQAAGSANGFSGSISATELRVGGIEGQIDEFLFSHRAGTSVPVVPTHPYQGIIDYRTLGGFGDGKYGNVTLTGTDVNVNTYAVVSGISGKSVVVGTRTAGIFGDFEAGDEIMIHVSLKQNASSTTEADLGKYSVRRLTAVNGSNLTLDKEVDEFTPSLSNYRLQAIKIPNFKTLTVPEGTILRPPAWDAAKGGGMVAIKTEGDCAVNGKILPLLKGPKRTDSVQLTHTDIIDRFILTGNVFIVCGGMLSAGPNARLGGDWDGSGKGGAGGSTQGVYGYVDGDSGTVGFGGAGSRNPDLNKPDNRGAPGFEGKGGMGRRQGTLDGNRGEDGRHSAANAILIAHTISVGNSAIVTGGGGGGAGGSTNNESGAGGGGGAFAGLHNNVGGSGGDGAGESGVGGSLNVYAQGGAPAGSGYGGGGGSTAKSTGTQGGGGSGTGFCFIAETKGA